jgi:hypothetical protein
MPFNISAIHGMGRRERLEPVVVPAFNIEAFHAARAAGVPNPDV